MDESIVGLIEPAENYISNRDAARQKVLYVCFLVCAVFVIFFPGPGRLAKYILIPVLMLLMYRDPIFDYLLFPLSFLDNPIGTLFFGKITLVWVYLALLLMKFILNADLRLKKSPFLILCICGVYFLFRISEYQMNAIKTLLFILCTMLAANLHEDDPDRLELMLFAIYAAALLQGLTMTLALTGTLEKQDRTTGIGFADPNYASFICVCGFCALLNAAQKSAFGKGLRVLGCVILVAGIFRSGSRSGFLVVTAVFLIHLLLQKGIQKKLRDLLVALFVLVIFLFLVTSGIIHFSNLDKLLERWFSMFDSLQTKNYSDATTNRSLLLQYYWNFYIHQDFLHVLFGGHVMGSTAMLRVGHGFVTHNVYMDYLLTFGFFFSILLFYYFAKRAVRYYWTYRETGYSTYLAVAEIKLSALMMGATLAMLRVNTWWLLALI